MKVFAVVGSPLKQSLSPFLHQKVFRRLGLPHVYIPWELKEDQLGAAVELFRTNLAGFNVTIPFKQRILDHLDDLDLSAELYGAVNTVKNERGRLIGFNTDGTGFLKGLEQVDWDLKGQRVLLLGAGGAAQTIALELAHQGSFITIANRNLNRAIALAVRIGERFPKAVVEAVSLAKIPLNKYGCVINATPVGMGALQGETPLHSQYLQGVGLVYDLIYNPAQTKLLQLAQAMGCQTVNGLPMLIFQGLLAQEIWLGRDLAANLYFEIHEEVRKELELGGENLDTPRP